MISGQDDCLLKNFRENAELSEEMLLPSDFCFYGKSCTSILPDQGKHVRRFVKKIEFACKKKELEVMYSNRAFGCL